ncbi:MAG: mannose-1-phosphate guanylyltransferase/mannose-6-phosphate isomerase [Bacillota bacterium]|nr:mannose-1-phosphate guanylyltransferase/mannose-6-phosphate isomerase [Bacillota bacterium]
MKIIILAGGGGTRLYPLSRSNYPKQFLNIDSDMSLLGNTINRYMRIVQPKDILIVSNKKYIYHVQEELNKCGAKDAQIISEPCARNTAPAIALAVRYCIDKLSVDEKEQFFVAPADHIITPEDSFARKVLQCFEYTLDNKIVTLGVKPDKPETGYGYIKAAQKYKEGFIVDKFVEKPDLDTAKQYLKDGNYYWNGGMYSFNLITFFDELKLHHPQLYDYLSTKKYERFVDDFDKLKSISIDYAIAEKSSNIVTVPLDVYWNDVGSWDSLYDYMDKDSQGNVQLGDCKTIDCRNSLLMSNNRLVAAVGLENTIVIETDDVIMVAKKGESQRVKEVYESLKNRTEAHEHTTNHRPWGYYTILSESDKYKVKQITVNPGQSLSLQLHNHRSEHWVVTSGQATVIIGCDDERTIHKNESIYVPKGTRHRLMNKSVEVLEIIEVQNGDYVGEDDIVRFDDVYGRSVSA